MADDPGQDVYYGDFRATCVPDNQGVTPRPTVSVDTTDPTSNEDGSTGLFTIRSNPAAVTDLKVYFELPVGAGGGNATLGDDYNVNVALAGNPPRRSVTIRQGQTEATVTVTPRLDLVLDRDETVVLRLQDDAAYTVGTRTGTVTITDFATNVVSVAVIEAPLNEANNPAKFRLTRTGNFAGGLTVNVQIGGTAQKGIDYTISPDPAASGSKVSFANANQTDLLITPIADTTPEPTRNITLTIQPATGSTTSDFYGIGNAADTMDLIDDDRPAVTLRASDPTASEAGANPGTFTLERTGPTGGTLSVTAVFVGSLAGTGSAAFSDYTHTGISNNQITFDVGSSTASVGVTPTPDTDREGTETIVLSIDTTSSAYNVVGPSTATVNLEDDDAPLVTVAATDPAASEAGLGTGTITVTRNSFGLASPLQVLYTLGGTANATGIQKDYAVTSSGGKLNFTAGSTTASITVTPIQDTRIEPTETVVITIVANGTQYGIGTPAAATVNLADDDTPATDTDGDGVPDATDNCLSVPNGQTQAGLDAKQNNTDADQFGDACDSDDDNDGLTDAAETATHKTKPKVRDTDGDGRSDGDEVTAGTDALDRFSPEYRPSGITATVTGSGIRINWTAPSGSLANRYLVFRESSPTLLATVPGVAARTSYSINDTQFPGGAHTYSVQAMLPSESSSAYNATLARTSPDAKVDVPVCVADTKDTDGDGLCDREEAALGTDPALADSDGDGRSDAREVADGTDPLDAASVAAKKVRLAREGPFWAGVALAVAAVALVVVAMVRSRRGPPAQPPS